MYRVAGGLYISQPVFHGFIFTYLGTFHFPKNLSLSLVSQLQNIILFGLYHFQLDMSGHY